MDRASVFGTDDRGSIPLRGTMFRYIFGLLVLFLSTQPTPVPDSGLISITVVGDIMPARTITANHPDSDFNYLYDSTRNLISIADLAIANLETPIIEKCKPFRDGMRFCAPPVHLTAIKSAGFDFLGLVNNHVYDYFDTGFQETIFHIQNTGLSAITPNQVVYKSIKNTKFAFIGVNYIPGYKKIDPLDSELVQLINIADQNSDIVIVFPHWGVEYQSNPSSHQKRLAHLMIDSGADLVLGSHPHWVQTTEKYQDKLIVYSHGNFVFDQFWSEATRKGIIGTYNFRQNQLVDYTHTPVYINLSGEPQI